MQQKAEMMDGQRVWGTRWFETSHDNPVGGGEADI